MIPNYFRIVLLDVDKIFLLPDCFCKLEFIFNLMITFPDIVAGLVKFITFEMGQRKES